MPVGDRAQAGCTFSGFFGCFLFFCPQNLSMFLFFLVPFLCKEERKQLLNVPCAGERSSPGSQLYPRGFGAKPQQGRVEADELRKVLGSLLDK